MSGPRWSSVGPARRGPQRRWTLAARCPPPASALVAEVARSRSRSARRTWASPRSLGASRAHLGLGVERRLAPLRDGIVWELRLPRVLTAAAVGAGLALAGAVMQASRATRSPTRTCSGCRRARRSARSPCCVLGVALLLPVAAFAGACSPSSRPSPSRARSGRSRPTRTVLAGLAVSQLAGAVTSFVIFWTRHGRLLPRDPRLAARLAGGRDVGRRSRSPGVAVLVVGIAAAARAAACSTRSRSATRRPPRSAWTSTARAGPC